MAKDIRQTVGTDGRPLPLLPPERDARVWARLVRIMFYTPGFMGLLLIKTGEPALSPLSALRLRHAALRRAQGSELDYQCTRSRFDCHQLCLLPPWRLRSGKEVLQCTGRDYGVHCLLWRPEAQGNAGGLRRPC